MSYPERRAIDSLTRALARGAGVLDAAQLARAAGMRIGRGLYQLAAKEYAAARAQVAGRARGYEAAGSGRQSEGWIASSASANAELRSAGAMLRNRTRQAVRDNPIARKIIGELVISAIGSGLRPKCRTGDKAIDKLVDGYWRAWAETGESDVGHNLPFAAQQTIAARAIFESGEVILRQRWRRLEDGLSVPLQIDVLEADHLDHTKNQDLPDGGYIVQGVEFDPIGRRRAYWLYRRHPGESFGRGVLDVVAVPADSVAHVYAATQGRPGQVRGDPWLSSILVDLRNLNDWKDAEQMRKKIESCLAAFVIGADTSDDAGAGIAPAVTDAATGQKVESFSPGMVALVTGGQDIKMSAPAAMGGISEWRDGELHDIAAGSGVTYEQATGDLSKVNYSSLRAGMLSVRAINKALREQIFVPLLCAPVWRWFIDALILAGKIAPRAGGYPAKWSNPRIAEIDRQKEVGADIADLGAGLASYRSIVENRGEDFDELLEDIAAERAQLAALGITPAWLAAPAPAATPAPATDDDTPPAPAPAAKKGRAAT